MTYNAPSYSDSPRNPNRYLGQDYRFTPCYIRKRNPVNGTSQTNLGDIKPKENQGRYPIGSLWINTASPVEIWILAAITVNGAQWVLIANSLIQGPLLTLSDNAGTVVVPSDDTANPPGNIQFVAGTGISVTAGTNQLTIAATGAGNETITSNTGGAVGPDGSGTINVIGGTTIFGTGTPGTSTVSLDVVTTNHSLIVGRGASTPAVALGVGTTNTVLLGNTGADPSFGTVPNAALTNSSITLNNGNNITVTGSPVSLGGAASIAVTGTTNHRIQLGNASGSLTSASALTDGQLLIGSSGVDPVAANLTAGTGVSIINGAGSITISAAPAVTNIVGDDGLQVVPNGSSNITLDGLVVATSTNAKPVYFKKNATSVEELDVQYAGSNATTNANKVGLACFNSNDFTVDASGFVSLIGGSTSPAATSFTLDAATTPITPTAGGVVTLTGGQVATGTVGANVIRTRGNTANSATIEIQRTTVAAAANSALNGVCHFDSSKFGVDTNGFVTFTGSTSNLPWTDQGGNFAAGSNQGYFCTALLTATLPATPAQGDIIRIVCDTASVVTVTANAGQKIRIGNVISALAGTAASTRQGDALDLVYRASSATWYAFSGPVGSWGVT